METNALTPTAAAALLDRYFAAETTLAEEARLRAFFRQPSLPAELEAYRPLFAYWEAAPSAPVRPLRRPRRRYLAAAAAVLLLIAGFFAFPAVPQGSDFPVAQARTEPIDWSQYEVTDPEEAVRILHGALKTTSAQLHRSAGLPVQQLKQTNALLR